MRSIVLALSLSFACLASAKADLTEIKLKSSTPNKTYATMHLDKSKPFHFAIYEGDPKLLYGLFVYRAGTCDNPVDIISASEIALKKKWIYVEPAKNGDYLAGFNPGSATTGYSYSENLTDFIYNQEKLQGMVFLLQVINKNGEPLGKVSCGFYP